MVSKPGNGLGDDGGTKPPCHVRCFRQGHACLLTRIAPRPSGGVGFCAGPAGGQAGRRHEDPLGAGGGLFWTLSPGEMTPETESGGSGGGPHEGEPVFSGLLRLAAQVCARRPRA